MKNKGGRIRIIETKRIMLKKKLIQTIMKKIDE